ncbi:MAG: DUF4388 domain-containing protein, partial [Acidobacteria bacterium]
MGITGNLKTMALADLLQWLSQGRKSGTLVIDDGQVEKKIFFDQGTIISSASTDRNEYLGNFLVSHGYLTEEQVDEAVAQQKEKKQLLGKILVEMGAIEEEDLDQLLRLKAEESIYDVFTWEEGDFRFLDGELPEEHMIPTSLDVQWLVLEGSRRLDEWARVREHVPSRHCVPVSVADLTQLEDLDEADARILALVDDERSVEEISQAANTSLFLVSQTLAQQVQAKTIKVVKPKVVRVEVPAKESAAQPPPPAQPAVAYAAA